MIGLESDSSFWHPVGPGQHFDTGNLGVVEVSDDGIMWI